MFDLTGKTALVTGSGRGIGAGIASALAAQGARVAVNDYFPERSEEMAETLKSRGCESISAAFDVTDMEAVREGVARIEAELAPVDIMVNNVGTLPHGMMPTPFTAMPEEEWKQHLDNNLYGTMNCTRCVVDGMKSRGWGRLITISSDAGRIGHYGSSIYGAAKAGMDAFMRTLALELGSKGITANSVVLGLINTVPEEFSRGLEKHYATGRIGTPEDVAAAVAYLASEEAGWVSAHSLVVNGAYRGG